MLDVLSLGRTYDSSPLIFCPTETGFRRPHAAFAYTRVSTSMGGLLGCSPVEAVR